MFDTIYGFGLRYDLWNGAQRGALIPWDSRRQNGRKTSAKSRQKWWNRSVMTKLSKEANDLLEDEPINKQRLDFIASSLNEKLKLVKTFDEEIIENCALDGIEAEKLESDSNAGIPTVPTTINASKTTSSGTNANEFAPSGFQQSTTVSGSRVALTLAFENAHIQLPGSWNYGETIQYQSFPDEVCNLVAARKLPEPPLLRQFNPYLDDGGLMRCRGRIQNSLLNQEAIMVLSWSSRTHTMDCCTVE